MIQVQRTDKHNRTLLFTGLPVKHRDDLPELEVRVNYTGESHCGNAIPLDAHIIPAIHTAFAALAVHESLVTALCRLQANPSDPRAHRFAMDTMNEALAIDTPKHIYNQMIAAGVKVSNHESDLYVPVNDVTRALVASYEFKSNVTTFQSQIEGEGLHYDIPFAYLPFWQNRMGSKGGAK